MAMTSEARYATAAAASFPSSTWNDSMSFKASVLSPGGGGCKPGAKRSGAVGGAMRRGSFPYTGTKPHSGGEERERGPGQEGAGAPRARVAGREPGAEVRHGERGYEVGERDRQRQHEPEQGAAGSDPARRGRLAR